jgi:SAM-dependent methyltransferase
MNEVSAGDEALSAPEVYGERYYACHCGPVPYDRSQLVWGEFFGSIADELLRTFRPRRVFDAGCAHGFLVEAFWDRGVAANGRDISKFAISNTRMDIRQYCSVGSLTEPIEGPFDLITCIEVLEHMTEEESIAAIANMTSAADRIVFSSSPTDLTEPTHINVKPPIYWIETFAAHDFAPLIETTLFSIAPYALAFERRKVKPSDDYLHACAEIVGDRMKRADDARVIHELSVTIQTGDRALAEKTAEFDRTFASLAADRDRLAAECERLAAEKEGALDELASAVKRSAAMQASLDEMIGANTHLHGLLDQVSRSRSWRIARELARIARQLRLPGSSPDPATDLLAQAKAGVLPSFDREFYVNQYPDVVEAGVDPLQHYIRHGRSEGRAASKMALELALHYRAASGAGTGSGTKARESAR